MRKLFISYRSSDAAKVDKIARDLALLRTDDGTTRFTTWQDKHNLPPASPNWWDAIVNAIIDSDIFVFNVSHASLQSEVCQSELDYAHKLNLPIIPVVLDGEYFRGTKSDKYDLPKDMWDLIPEWLKDSQLMFYTGAEFYDKFQQAVEMFERSWPLRLNPKRPLNPDSKSVHGSNHSLYDAACDYAERLAFADAEKHFYELVGRKDADYADVAVQWLELLRLYSELIEIDERPNARFKFKSKWTTYIALFPKEFLDGIFDPKDFNVRYGNGVVLTPSPSRTGGYFGGSYWGNPSITQISRPTSLSIMPAPFAWIDIPHKAYSIAKYPITNAQFAKFIEADGYQQKKWWTRAGWHQHEKNKWTEPRYWIPASLYGAEHPVVGVSWYESVAFCLWLTDVTGEKIMLPNEDQWQYAAQGDDMRDYPWGKNWDGNRCNHKFDKKGVGKTTSVRKYEGKGDSPFGVVDMAGNVWEWCLTDDENATNDIDGVSDNRVIRGGSWASIDTYNFRCDNFDGDDLGIGYGSIGFRISRS
jgi:formylglycine-generating enzyme required for sulfatase activity